MARSRNSGADCCCCPSLTHVRLFAPHGLQHTRLPCPSLSPEACFNSCLLSWWCQPTLSSSVIPFSCLQFFPSIRVFSNESVLHIRGQSTGALTSGSVLPMDIQDWFPLGLNDHLGLNLSFATYRLCDLCKLFNLSELISFSVKYSNNNTYFRGLYKD